MSSPGFEMSLEHQIPVLMKKTQMNGEHGGPQCGLTSLLPMSCRGRAAAFARDLHTRLRNLGTAHQDDDDGESSWLAADPAAAAAPLRAASASPRELDTFYDFELECESPSSPVDECDAPFSDRMTNDEPPFYDFDSDADAKEAAKLKLQQPEKTRSNGFRFATTFYSDSSPIKLQPAPRENGHPEKKLFSPITFEGCARQNSQDETDCFATPISSQTDADLERLSLPLLLNTTLDSDSEFESAKSEPSECIDDVFVSEKPVDDEVFFSENSINDVIQEAEKLSVSPTEQPNDVNAHSENETIVICSENITKENTTTENTTTENTTTENTTTEIITEVSIDKELSPVLEVDETLLSTDNKAVESDETDDDRPQRVRRCSSLKTGKTPPGTPGRKKIVRFADVLGLDLADIKTFMDEIPVIPKSAYDDLTGCDMQNSPPVRAPPRFGSLTLVPLFQVPRDVTDKLEKLNVCLETAIVGEGIHINICGSVRVRNLDFHKTVHIRYSMNRWKTYTDLQTTYVSGSCDGYSDRFQFVLYAPCISSGQRLELAVRFLCKGQQFWDNNSGANYCFDCLALGGSLCAPGPLHPTVDWHPSFY